MRPVYTPPPRDPEPELTLHDQLAEAVDAITQAVVIGACVAGVLLAADWIAALRAGGVS